ncbi:MAG: sugar phosphate isomerase/epimerase family protein [Rhodothermales bacterium]
MPNRRDFLKTGFAATLTGATAPLDDIDARNGVALAIATICLDGFGDEDFAPAFRLVPQIGVRNVEFNVWYPRNLTPTGIDRIRERCYTNGLKPICLQGTAFGGNGVRDVTHKLWLMEQARALGCRRVKFTGERRPDDNTKALDQVIATLKELAPAAEDLDVLVLVENHANNVLENIDDYARIFDAVPSRHVGMCQDTGHFDGARVNNFEVVERFHERILHIDLKDTIAFGTYKTVNYGTGATDVSGIVRANLAHGYSGYLLIEQAPPLNPETLVADMVRARELFSRFER